MKIKSTRKIAFIMTLFMVLSLFTACGKSQSGSPATTTPSATDQATPAPAASGDAEKAKTPDPVELQFYFPGDPVNGMQEVLDEFYNRTKDTINAKLVFNWIPWNDLKNTLSVKLAAGEPMDSVFDAQWNQMYQMIAKDAYVNLDKYFNNDNYPGLKKAFPADYIDNNKFVDSTGTAHIYGVPFTREMGSLSGFIVRQDLREKYGLPEIKDLAGLEAYFDAVLKNEGGKVTPVGINFQNGISNYLGGLDLDPLKYPFVTAGDGLYFNTIINPDKTVKLVLPGEDATATPTWDIERSWYTKGYVEKDVMSQQDALGLFKVGKFAAVFADQATITSSIYAEVAKNIPGAKLEFVTVNPAVSAKQQHVIPSEFKAWNFACIPATSPNADRTMAVLDWIYADQSNHDLFEYGIEGKNWVAVGNDQFKLPDGVDPASNYNFPGYVLTWNPGYVRLSSDLPQSSVDWEKYALDLNTYAKLPLAGFSFNAEPVKNEVAKCAPLSKDLHGLTNVGLVENPDEQYKALNAKMADMGLEKIRDEMKKQIEAFLATQK